MRYRKNKLKDQELLDESEKLMQQYLSDPQFIKELKEVEAIANFIERPKKMIVTEDEYEDLKNSGSDMDRFITLQEIRRRKKGELEHIAPIMMGVIKNLQEREPGEEG